jgi:hypothetical protein
MSGIMANEKCRNVLSPGTHATTFGANPVCAAAGLVVQETLDDAFLAEVSEKGKYLREQIEALNERLEVLADIPVKEEDVLSVGTGFGALEIMRMKKDGDGIAPQSMLFPESTVGRVEAPFKELLETGRLPETDVKNIPEAYMISYKWIPRLKAAAESRDANWNELMHYGIAVYEYQNTSVYLNESFDEKEDAEQTRIAKWAFESSLSKKENVWSLRNLAMIARHGGDDAKAEQLYDKALSVEGAFSDYALTSEYLFYLVKLEKNNNCQIFRVKNE